MGQSDSGSTAPTANDRVHTGSVDRGDGRMRHASNVQGWAMGGAAPTITRTEWLPREPGRSQSRWGPRPTRPPPHVSRHRKSGQRAGTWRSAAPGGDVIGTGGGAAPHRAAGTEERGVRWGRPSAPEHDQERFGGITGAT